MTNRGDMELWEYVEVLLRWGWVILVVTALCTVASVGVVKLQTPRYTSSVELAVTPSRLEQVLSQAVVNLLRNYVSGIQSENMARRVIDRLSLNGADAAVLRRQIRAEANEAEYKIKIEVTDRDPVFAQRVAQETAQVFVEDVAAFALRQDPLDRLTATMLNGGAQPANRTWPRSKLLVVAGVGSGVTLGLLIALGLEWARVDIAKTPSEVEQWLGVAILGNIPVLEETSRAGRKRPTGKDRN
jgi:capsular polysaccharide biosynthesis protein